MTQINWTDIQAKVLGIMAESPDSEVALKFLETYLPQAEKIIDRLPDNNNTSSLGARLTALAIQYVALESLNPDVPPQAHFTIFTELVGVMRAAKKALP